MKRREFFRAVVAVAAAATLPVPASIAPVMQYGTWQLSFVGPPTPVIQLKITKSATTFALEMISNGNH
jgi:hypothetical protein